METLSSLKFPTFLLFAWLTLVLCGPYISMDGLPLRLDHFLFPSAGVLILIWLLWKQKSFCVSKPLVFFSVFVGFVFISTALVFKNPEFYFKRISLLADLENHLRIALILWICAAFSRIYEISVPSLLKALFWVCVLLAFFAVLQVWQKPDAIQPFYQAVKKFSVDWYSGRHSRGINLVECCVGYRAVSTFYHPGNLALFCVLVGSIYLLVKDRLGLHPLIYWGGLFVIWLGAAQTLSKGFLGGIFFLGMYLLLHRRWVHFVRFTILILMVFGASFRLSDNVTILFMKYFKNTTMIGIYNLALGPRFGCIENPPLLQNQSISITEPQTFTKPQVLSAFTSASAHTLEVPKKIWGEGYLSDSMKVIKTHPWFGVGYVSNVSAGDSMVVHLLVRGGILGSALFTFFLVMMAMQVWKKRNLKDPQDICIRESWILCASFFFISGIAFPTFIQDRTGDLFWWIGGLLVVTGNVGNGEKVKRREMGKLGNLF